MPQQAWSNKRERQYEHIKESAQERGMSAVAIEDSEGTVRMPRLAPTRAERRRQLV